MNSNKLFQHQKIKVNYRANKAFYLQLFYFMIKFYYDLISF